MDRAFQAGAARLRGGGEPAFGGEQELLLGTCVAAGSRRRLGVAARAYEAGCDFQHFDRRWDTAGFCEWLERFQITHTSLVPTQVHDLVKAGLSAPPALTVIVVGGGHLDPATGQAA